MSVSDSRLPPVSRATIKDPDLQRVLEQAERLSTPKPAWYLTLAHNPEMAKAYAAYWDITHRGGRVEHTIKELMRITIAQMLDCDFCASQRSVLAQQQGLDENVVAACMSPDFQHSDPRTRAALHYARVLTQDSADDRTFDQVYAELREVFDEGEIVELGCFAAIAIGGVKLSRSLKIEP